MPESKYWIKPASWRLTDLACRPARSDSSRLRCSLAISRLPSRSSTKSYCGEEQTGARQVTGWPAAPPASPQHPDDYACILTRSFLLEQGSRSWNQPLLLSLPLAKTLNKNTNYSSCLLEWLFWSQVANEPITYIGGKKMSVVMSLQSWLPPELHVKANIQSVLYAYGLIIVISHTNNLLCFSFSFRWRITLFDLPFGQSGALEEGEQELCSLCSQKPNRGDGKH